jgi:hypothetical protein
LRWNFYPIFRTTSEWNSFATICYKNIDADCIFPLPVWFECTASSLRTIKACELFHANFNAIFYSAHHDIFVLISALQKIQNETYIKMRSVTTRRFKK